MAKFVLTNAYTLINAVDLSDHVESVTVNYSAEAKDATCMGDGTKVNLGGLKEWSADINFRQDLASGKVDATLFALVGTVVAVEFASNPTPFSATNPRYTGQGLITGYNPIGGSVGDVAGASVTIACSGTLTRAVS